MYLIVQFRPDSFGLYPSAKHLHFNDLKQATSAFEKWVKKPDVSGCKVILDEEYETAYGIKAGKDRL